MQYYFKRRLESLEKSRPNLTLLDLLECTDYYLKWYQNVYGPTKLMKTILED